MQASAHVYCGTAKFCLGGQEDRATWTILANVARRDLPSNSKTVRLVRGPHQGQGTTLSLTDVKH